MDRKRDLKSLEKSLTSDTPTPVPTISKSRINEIISTASKGSAYYTAELKRI